MSYATLPSEYDNALDNESDLDLTLPSELAVNQFLIKEHVGFFKASSSYDIYDLQTGELLLCCREPQLGLFTKLFRFTKYKCMTPFDVHVTTASGEPCLQVRRGLSLLLSHVHVSDASEVPLGSFKQKFFSLGGRFDVLNVDNEPVCQLAGKWSGWDFRFQSDGQELARVTKKWNGLGKELFTSADNYVLEISDEVPASSPLRALILAAVLTIDLVLKE